MTTVWPQIAIVALGIMLIETANLASGGQKPVVVMAWESMKPRKRWWLGPILLMLAFLSLAVLLTHNPRVAPTVYKVLSW